MKQDTVVSLKKPVAESDPLTALLRAGAQQLLHEAVAAELAEYLSQYQAERDADGRCCIVRNGYLPARTVMTGLGEVRIQVPKTRDRRGRGRHFTSALLPPYIKRTASVEGVLPWLYLKGVSTGDMSAALLGEQARGCVSRTSLLTMVYKLGLCAEQNWRRMRGFHHLADVIENVKFIDGVKEETIQQHQQAA